jgi:type II secretory pathway pseudopilin PulG
MSFSSCRHRCSRAPGGFTILELLAVVTTVVLLGCVIVPAMTRTSTFSQSTQCVNHLRQLMQATLMYSGDYNDLLPPNPDDGNPTPGYNWCAGQAGIGGADEFDPDLLADPTQTLISPYLHSKPEVFRCPADPRSGPFEGAALYPNSPRRGLRVGAARSVSMNNAVGTVDPCYANGAGHCGSPKLPVNGPWLTGSYGANSAIRGPWRTYGKTSQIVAPIPARLWVITEESELSVNDACFAMSAALPIWLDYPATRHHGGGALGFADAHVELHRWISPSTVLSFPASTRAVAANDPDWLWLSVRTSARLQK